MNRSASFVPTMTQKVRHDRIERGREAGSIDTAIRDFVGQKLSELTTRAISNYRAGAPDRVFFGLAAEMSALSGLLSSLESAQRQGEVALEQEISDGTKAAGPRSY